MASLQFKEKLRDGLYSHLDQVEGKGGGDTIRLWEGYRDQAYFWRALALVEIPATCLSLLFALVVYATRYTVVEVPAKTEPGRYTPRELPDNEFKNVGGHFVNLISSYTPATAPRQFAYARTFLWEPALTQFQAVMIGQELKAIDQTARSQLFFIDDTQTRVQRSPDDTITVRVSGTKKRLIADKPLKAEEQTYYLKMTTIPKNIQNPYGIVIVDVRIREISSRELETEDERENLINARRERAKAKH